METTTFLKYKNSKAAIALVTLTLSVLGFLPGSRPLDARAQKTNTPAAPVFASVDLQKCSQESKARQVSEDELRGMAQSLDRSLQRLAGSSSRFLTDVEVRELAALYEKPQPTEPDKKRAQELETKGDAGSAELSRLQQVATPSDADKKRFTELTEQQQRGDGVLQSVKETYSSRLQAKREELSMKYLAQIRETVAKVAKEKNFTVVFDAQFALYTANDITADVIKQLNK
ncbi:MAG: OmpH family outer membrane protein [Cytophagales bacterium]|nr:OmpH family outer membrane protein [Armatimonadota bacterium]